MTTSAYSVRVKNDRLAANVTIAVMKKILTFMALFFLALTVISVRTSRKLLSVQSASTPNQDGTFIPPKLSSRPILPFDMTIDQLYVHAANDLEDDLQQLLEERQRALELQQILRQHHDGWKAVDREEGGVYIVSPRSPSLTSVKSVLNVLRGYLESDEPRLVVKMQAVNMEEARNLYKNLLVVHGALDEMKEIDERTKASKCASEKVVRYDSIKDAYSQIDACQTIKCLRSTLRSDMVRIVMSTNNHFQVQFKLTIADLDDSIIAWLQLLNGIVRESMRGRVLDSQDGSMTRGRVWSLLFHNLLSEEADVRTFFQMKLTRNQQETVKHCEQLRMGWEILFDTILRDESVRTWIDSHWKHGAFEGRYMGVDREYVALLKTLVRDQELRRLFESVMSKRKLEHTSNPMSVARSKRLSDKLNDFNDDDMLSFGVEMSFLYPDSTRWIDSLGVEMSILYANNTRWIESLFNALREMMKLQVIHNALGHAGISSTIYRSMESLKKQSTIDGWKLAQEHKGFELVSPLNPPLKSVETVLDIMKELGVRTDQSGTALHVSIDARNKTVEQIRNVFKNFIVIEKALDEVRDPPHRAGRSSNRASIAQVFSSAGHAFRMLDACESVACLEKTAEPTEYPWHPLYIMCLRVEDDSRAPDFTKLNNLRFEFRGIRSTTQSKVALGWVCLLNRFVQESFRGRVLEARERTVDEAWSALFGNLLSDYNALREFFEEERIRIRNAAEDQKKIVNARWARLFDAILANRKVRASFDDMFRSNTTFAETEYSELLHRLQRDNELRKLFDISRSQFPAIE